MNSIVTGNTQGVTPSEPDRVPAVNKNRTWSTEQDGKNDKTVDIWWNGNWVPAYFKDILAGDFFLMIGTDLEPGRCFLAGSDAKKCGVWQDHQTFIIQRGMEIVQAPTLKDIDPANTLPHQVPPLLEKE